MYNLSTMGVKAIMSFLEIAGKIYRGGENRLLHRWLEPQPVAVGGSLTGHTPIERSSMVRHQPMATQPHRERG